MPSYDANAASCHVYTFKEGLLSKVAHDLKIEATRFSIEVAEDASSVEASFDLGSLRVVCARKDGRDELRTLSDSDKRKIEKNLRDDVLQSARHPEATFRSTSVEPDGDGYRVRGDLTLHGRTRAIDATVTRAGDAFETRVKLHQPDFGIKPFSAMMGTLKVKPDVEVVLRVPVE